MLQFNLCYVGQGGIDAIKLLLFMNGSDRLRLADAFVFPFFFEFFEFVEDSLALLQQHP
jgi:hypothetical protein